MASDETNGKSRRFGLGRLWRRGGGEAAEPDTGPDDIVDSAEAFKSLRVSDVMTPRADVVAVELDTPFSELLARFVEAEHSRMPIYRETLDDPLGFVHVKDVFKLLAGGGKAPFPDDTVLKRLRRDVLFVPPSMPASALLTKMQASRIHMAVVIDEFGGADGLVTLEDLLEAVVGEIEDEHDETEAPKVITRAGGVVEADGRAALEDLAECVGRSVTPEDLDEDIDTVGGLVGALAGRLPQRGEVIAHPDGFEFEILDADPRRVRRVRVRDVRPAGTGEEGAAG